LKEGISIKQHITPEDLTSLSESRKANLRDLWLPEVNTLAVASLCRDVVNNEYDNIVFVIGEVYVQEESGALILRRMSLPGDSLAEEDNISDENEPRENKDEFTFEYSQPEEYFSKEDCLPLLNIGGLIDFLSRVRYGQGGFDISIPPVRRLVGDKGCSVINRNELEYEEEELCDALWNALVECL